MVVVHREAGMRFVIFKDDHEPAHIHVFGDGDAKINLIGTGGMPELIFVHGMKISDVRRALRIVKTQQFLLLKRWREIHG
jgi:Domain of unknown function (DUF4160)